MREHVELRGSRLAKEANFFKHYPAESAVGNAADDASQLKQGSRKIYSRTWCSADEQRIPFKVRLYRTHSGSGRPRIKGRRVAAGTNRWSISSRLLLFNWPSEPESGARQNQALYLHFLEVQCCFAASARWICPGRHFAM